MSAADTVDVVLPIDRPNVALHIKGTHSSTAEKLKPFINNADAGIIYCNTIAHCKRLPEEISLKVPGVQVASFYRELDIDQKAKVLRDFKSGANGSCALS